MEESINHTRKRPRLSSAEHQVTEKSAGFSGLFASSSGKTLVSYRLQHRTSENSGEERLLLFQSGRSGPCGKLIFTVKQSSCSRDACCSIIVKIVHLFVKVQSRGNDLGGLLISELLDLLRRRYLRASLETNVETINGNKSERCTVVKCELEAEEDDRRNNKLVRFYERLGFHVKPNAKISFLNNNDGEVYRKVPMELVLNSAPPESEQSLVHPETNFLPIRFVSANGRGIRVEGAEGNALLVDHGDGSVELRTTRLSSLCPCLNNTKERRDTAQSPLPNHKCSIGKFHLRSIQCTGWMNNKNWLLQSEHNNCFLAVNRLDNTLAFTSTPVVWTFDDTAASFFFTGKTLSDCLHADGLLQSAPMDCLEQIDCLSSPVCQMSLFEALELSKRVKLDETVDSRCLYNKCFQTAETFRWAGHPDWIQLLGLTYYLGGIRPLLKEPEAGTPSQLTLSDSEYVRHVLLSNKIAIPAEGFQILRLASLEIWRSICSACKDLDDGSVGNLVAEFASTLADAHEAEMATTECRTVWDSHYRFIAEKYNMHAMEW